MIFKITLQYDGTDYVGWQRQATGVSIQGLIEDALAPIAGQPVPVAGAGRTDAGVHALGQVASAAFQTRLDPDVLRRALNAVLPADVRAALVEPAADDFHARFSASFKTYEYRIANGPFVSPFDYRYRWHVPQRLEVDAMRQAAGRLVGQHDFAAFRAVGSEVKTTVRHLARLDVLAGGSEVRVVATADGFLRHMVRAIVGTLVDVGLRRMPLARVSEVLESRNRAQAGATAPPAGLFLVSVEYRGK